MHAFVSKAAMSSVCTLHPCRLWRRLAKKENKHRWSPQHVQLLWRDWARQSSQVQDQSICMVHIFAGGINTRVRTPRKWAPWCSFSRMVLANLCAGARLRGGGGGGGGGNEYAVTPAVPNFVRSCSKKPTLHAKKRQCFTQVDTCRIAGPFLSSRILIQKIIEFPWKRAYPVK